MVGGNDVDNFGIDPMALGEFRTNLRMCAFCVVVHSLAQVVQQSTCLGDLHIGTQLCCDHAGDLGGLNGMRELGFARRMCGISSGLESFQDLTMQACNTSIISSLLTGFGDILIHLLVFFLEEFLDIGGVDAPVDHQS